MYFRKEVGTWSYSTHPCSCKATKRKKRKREKKARGWLQGPVVSCPPAPSKSKEELNTESTKVVWQRLLHRRVVNDAACRKPPPSGIQSQTALATGNLQERPTTRSLCLPIPCNGCQWIGNPLYTAAPCFSVLARALSFPEHSSSGRSCLVCLVHVALATGKSKKKEARRNLLS